MLQFITTDSILNDSTNICTFSTEKSNFNDNIEINRLSENYPENVSVGTDDAIETYTVSGVLNTTIDHSDFLLTDEVQWDVDKTNPLWYEHETRYYFYNETLESRGGTRYITEEYPVITDLFEVDSRSIIIKDSIVVWSGDGTVGTSVVIPETDYIVNYGEGSIVFTNQATIDLYKAYRVSYYILTPDLVILENDTPYDRTLYRLEVEFVYGDSQPTLTTNAKYLFKCKVLVAERNSLDKTYTLEYRTIKDGSITEIEEILKASPIFQKVTALSGSYQEYVYDSDTGEIRLISTSEHYTYYIKNNLDMPTKIAIDNIDIGSTDPWYLQVYPNEISIGTNTYSILEKQNYRYLDSLWRIGKIIHERAYVIDNRKLRVKRQNLIVRESEDYTIENIEIYVRDKAIGSDKIVDYDRENGILVLSFDLNPLVPVYVSYEYAMKTVPYEQLQLNPNRRFSSTSQENVILKTFIVFVLPKEILNESYGRSIFHYTIEKYPELYINKEEYELNVDKAIEYLGTFNTETGLSNIYDLFDSKYFSDLTQKTITPMYLCYVGSINTSTASSTDILDIRVRGGGIPVDITKLEMTKEESDVLNNIDIVYMDGERYPSNNVYIVRVTGDVMISYKKRLSDYDKDVIRYRYNHTEEEVTLFIQSKAQDIFEATIKRFLPVAAHIIYEYVEA